MQYIFKIYSFSLFSIFTVAVGAYTKKSANPDRGVNLFYLTDSMPVQLNPFFGLFSTWRKSDKTASIAKEIADIVES